MLDFASSSDVEDEGLAAEGSRDRYRTLDAYSDRRTEADATGIEADTA
jgi:hypothetical protein